MTKRAFAWLRNRIPKVRQMRFFVDVKGGIRFNVKGFVLFFLVTLGGTFAGSYINNILGLTGGQDIFSYLLLMLVPVLITYILYENFIRKRAI